MGLQMLAALLSASGTALNVVSDVKRQRWLSALMGALALIGALVSLYVLFAKAAKGPNEKPAE